MTICPVSSASSPGVSFMPFSSQYWTRPMQPEMMNA